MYFIIQYLILVINNYVMNTINYSIVFFHISVSFVFHNIYLLDNILWLKRVSL